MREGRFIAGRQSDWRQLEDLLPRLADPRRSPPSAADLEVFLRAYRRAATGLAYAQSRYPGRPITGYLNHLVARGHVLLYGSRTSSWRQVGDYFLRRFPAAVRAHLSLVGAAALIFTCAAAAGYAAVHQDPSLARHLLPQEFQQVLSAERAGDGQPAGEPSPLARETMPLFSSLIITHNIQVAFLAFGAGLLWGVGTAYLVAANGLLLGALAALFRGPEQSVAFWSLILPHGVMELLAIFISAAAGFRLAGALVDPGDLPRRDALAQRGRESLPLLLGTLPLFAVAGLIEGFFTPLPLPPWSKLAFAGTTLPLLALYLGLAGRTRSTA